MGAQRGVAGEIRREEVGEVVRRVRGGQPGDQGGGGCAGGARAGRKGGAGEAAAQAGAEVCQIDGSKVAIGWARDNAELSGLKDAPIRWILEDAVEFVKRELKRGQKYDGIIMDPPAFGHSPDGKTWKFNENLPGLLNDCVELLSDNAKFLCINGYATNSSALALNNLLEDAIKSKPGKIEFGELCLKQKSGRLISTGIFSRWSRS